MMSLDQLRQNYTAPERTSGMPNNYYPFWLMKEGESAIIRFLPDANESNPLGFLVEKVMHNLEINGERKSVPCMSMYGQPCPVCAVSQEYYSRDDKINGKKYWKKRQYLAQALIVKDPLQTTDGESHEGKVRYVTINYSLYKIIKDAFESGELDEVPFAYEGGTDFIIKKDMQGEYPSYILSKFARRTSDLDADVVDSLGLIDLSTLLPKNMGTEKIESMLEAALSGGDYVEPTKQSSTPAATVEQKLATEMAVESTTAETSSTASTDDDTDEEVEALLADIRKRRAVKEA